MPIWLRESLARLGVAAITLFIWAFAMALGTIVAVEIGEGGFWIGVTVAVCFLVFIVLPLRLWWVTKNAPRE